MLALLLIFMLLITVLHLNLKQKITVVTDDDGTKNVEIMVPLKYYVIYGELFKYL